VSQDHALALLTVGAVAVILGGLQALTGFDALWPADFLYPAPRWVGRIVAAVGTVGVVVAAVSLWLMS
jgi:hypothetical protein